MINGQFCTLMKYMKSLSNQILLQLLNFIKPHGLGIFLDVIIQTLFLKNVTFIRVEGTKKKGAGLRIDCVKANL